MFTGLVREIGRLRTVGRRGGITTLELAAPVCAPLLSPGDSLAVNGICLTVTRQAEGRVWVEATSETRRVSTLGAWRVGSRLHLEPALRAGDAMGGHLVLGHVDAVGRVSRVRRRQGGLWLTVALPRDLAAVLLPKGSIAVDGVSLTLDEGPFADCFTVTVVPYTLAATTLGSATVGREVNIELDVLAKAARSAAAHAGADVWGGAAAAAASRIVPGTAPAEGAGAAPGPASQGQSPTGAGASTGARAPLTVGALLQRGFGSRMGRR